MIERYGVEQWNRERHCVHQRHAGCGRGELTRSADVPGRAIHDHFIADLMKTAGLKCQRRTEGAT
jgi:hypothetical protein